MKFNVSYFGPEPVFHLRHDFIAAIKYGLESLGHDVILSGRSMELSRFNLLIGAYFLPAAQLKEVDRSGLDFAHINTEVIAKDMLNFDPAKTDFLGDYLPSMRAGKFVWDVILDNLAQHRRYGTNAYFMRWGWHPKLEDIEHREPKDLDAYFFGFITPRREKILKALLGRGVEGLADHSCPRFLRNDRIARAKVNLNIIQDDAYSHVNSFRTCYLANNRCAILSEAENDPAGYLAVARTVRSEAELADALADLLAGDKWKRLGEAGYEKFRATAMTDCLAELLEVSFGSVRGAPASVN
jgi:hypothetical protein